MKNKLNWAQTLSKTNLSFKNSKLLIFNNLLFLNSRVSTASKTVKMLLSIMNKMKLKAEKRYSKVWIKCN